MKKKTVEGFTLTELTIVTAIIAILFAIFMPILGEKKKAIIQAKEMERTIIKNGLGSPTPICLGQGWYYIGESTNKLDLLIGLIAEQDPQSFVKTYPAMSDYFDKDSGSAIQMTVAELGITNGMFVFFKKYPE